MLSKKHPETAPRDENLIIRSRKTSQRVRLMECCMEIKYHKRLGIVLIIYLNAGYLTLKATLLAGKRDRMVSFWTARFWRFFCLS